MYKIIFKPFCDFFISLLLLIILSPIIIATSILLYLANYGKVFFFQQRPGLLNKPFIIIKFKTMRDAFDENGNPLSDALRITRFGKIVRSASLDELLQLINVLKGDMSLVGPRPLLMQYLSRYTKEQAKRHNVKPGITGWAQINGRDDISIEKKVQLEQEYMYKRSTLFDIEIIIKTFTNVLFSKGVSH